MAYFNRSSSSIITSTCRQSIDTYVHNMTSTYASRSNEFPVVFISVAMLLLAVVFLCLCLFSHVSDVSSILNPTARLCLSGVVSGFLPAMSYLFSEAQSVYECEHDTSHGGGSSEEELPPLARQILAWMLLVELLRRKVLAINIVTEGSQRYIGILAHFTDVAWLGYLVFFNIKEPGRVAVFSILWIICATKLVQRIVFAMIMMRSLSYDKNARLISSYMGRIMPQLRPQHPQVQPAPAEMLETCSYLVMGEEKLVASQGAGPRGYRLLLDNLNTDDEVVTVGKVWRLAMAADVEEGEVLKSNPGFTRLCLSSALFKLLRRRIERLPAMTIQETDQCRDLIFQGLCGVEEDAGVAVFEVLNDEIDFLSEYYHSTHPVVFASPYFLAVNYLGVLAVLCCLGVMMTIVYGNGNVPFAFRSILVDNYAVSTGVFRLLKCLLISSLDNPQAFFPAVDVFISCLFFFTFLLEQLREFILLLLSKWFMVSLLCTYTAKTRWRRSAVLCGAIRHISWARTKLGHPSVITFRQFSVLSACRLSLTLTGESLPKEAMRSIVKRFRLAAYNNNGRTPLSNGCRALEMPGRRHLSWFCESDSVAEVILTWHIATTLLALETKHHPQQKQKVATRLSNYCAYLVGFHPELLPDDREGTKRAYKNMKRDLRKVLGYWGYHFSSERARCKKMMTLSPDDSRHDSMTVVHKGIALGKALVQASRSNELPVWELLDDVWVELIVYVAPSGSDEHVKGHEEALEHGGELLTLIWALATHTGITRPPTTAVDVERVEEGICCA